MEWPVLTTAFMLGLLSSAHCVGMCGGIMGALTMAIPSHAKTQRWQLLLSYNLGRIASYSLMGLLVGVFASGLAAIGAATWLRWLAGLLLVAMGLYLANWWRGLTYIEAGGRYLWAYLQPLGKGLMPVTHPGKALLLGALWGWLPCGLVYSALAYAMAQAHGSISAATMLAFGLGTLPMVLATGFAAHQLAKLVQRRAVRLGFALIIIVFGLWTLWGGGHVGHAHHHSASGPDDAAQMHTDHTTMRHLHTTPAAHNNQHSAVSSAAEP